MTKNMKQRLREQQETNHEELRQQMVQDLTEQLDEWREATNCIMAKNHGVINDAVEQMQTYKRLVRKVGDNLSSIEYKTLQEIKRFKRGRSWKFYGACFLASLLGGITAVLICARYWATIRSFMG